MSETPTPTQAPNENDPFAQNFQDHVALESRNAAFRIMHDEIARSQTEPDSSVAPSEANDPTTKKKHPIRNGMIATSLIVGLPAGAGYALSEAPTLREATFSSDSTEHMVDNGESIDSIAHSIPGADSANIDDVTRHIAEDPANIPVLKDGLQAGETIEIPVSVNGGEDSNNH